MAMVRQEVWEEWTGQVVEGTDWGKGAKDEWKQRRGQYFSGVGSRAWIEIRTMIGVE